MLNVKEIVDLGMQFYTEGVDSMFDVIFYGVCAEFNLPWYEVFDGVLFDKRVVPLIAEFMMMEIDELESFDKFIKWVDQMADDL